MTPTPPQVPTDTDKDTEPDYLTRALTTPSMLDMALELGAGSDDPFEDAGRRSGDERDDEMDEDDETDTGDGKEWIGDE